MFTVLDEPKIVQNLNTEYYRLVNFYSNIKRPASFIKYYNLSVTKSPKHDITKETYDYYTKTRNYWDVYDLTPVQIISPVQNAAENTPDLKGTMTTSATTILTYTLDNPRIGDLVTFYKPAESEEVLRVMNLRLQLNSNFSTEPIRWYELDLESAPIKFDNLGKLLKNDHFVYDLTIEKNVEYKYYKSYFEKIRKLEKLLNTLNDFYDPLKDMYIFNNIIIVELNELLFHIKKKFDNKYYRLFERIKAPYGYWDHYSFKYPTLHDMNFNETSTFTLIDQKTGKLEEFNVPSRMDQKKLGSLLKKIINLLNYIKEIEVYIEHPERNNNTSSSQHPRFE